MSLKIIGAGFGRTGTLSLKFALETLGFTKCYHMSDVIRNPRFAHYWIDAYEGKKVDWELVFAGYQATVDWPGCTFYKELMQAYPDAKVLLSVRDPDKWYQSAYDTIFGIGRTLPNWLKSVAKWLPKGRFAPLMPDQLIWQGTFAGKFEDKAYAIEIFNRHIAEVKQVVPPEKLLIFDVKEGWAPLCRFLEVPEPAGKPFPHVNDTAEFQGRIRTLRRVLLGVSAGVVMLLLVALWWVVQWVR